MRLSSADRLLFVWLSRPTGEPSARMLSRGASPWDTLSAALASGIYGPQYHMTPTIKSVTIAARSMATKWGIVSTPHPFGRQVTAAILTQLAIERTGRGLP